MDVLSDILRSVHVKGSLYFRTAFSSPWGVSVPRYRSAWRYHLVSRGRCWVKIEGVDTKIKLEKGDLILIANGAAHDLFCEHSVPPFPVVEDVVAQAEFDGAGALVWGGNDTDHETTELVCGHFTFDSERGRMMLASLPPYIHVANTEMMHYGWLESAMRFITYETFEREIGSEAIIDRLAEIIFIQTIRTYARSGKDKTRLMAALADEQIGKVLDAIHRDPASDWTVRSLAREAGISRTVLSERMREVLGLTPIAYLTHWRMELAHLALIHDRDSIPEISESVGYNSLSAFSRTFKKHFGRGPGDVRKHGSADHAAVK